MSGVVSATDHFTMLALGRAGFERLVRSRVDADLEDELAVRDTRITELRELAVRRRRVEELMNVPGYSVWTATPRPASEARRPATTPKSNNPWSISLRENATPCFTIHLEGETPRMILADVADIAPEGLETGGAFRRATRSAES